MESPPPGNQHSQTVSYNAWLGVVLFLLYSLLYAGFIYMSAFDRERMGADAVAGVNLAVIYGFGLIFAAFVVACLYMLLCRREPAVTDPETKQENR